MSKGSLNKVMIIGKLGQDPELKYTPQGASVCSFSIATDEGYKDSNGNQVDRTEWHRIVIWRKLAEIAGQYLKKGSLVYIEGKLQTRSWDKDGQKHYTTEIVASDMTMLGGKGDAQAGGGGYSAPQSNPLAQARPQAAAAPQAPVFGVPDTVIEEDDLPF
jgi:single-strand DNA-binding protein